MGAVRKEQHHFFVVPKLSDDVGNGAFVVEKQTVEADLGFEGQVAFDRFFEFCGHQEFCVWRYFVDALSNQLCERAEESQMSGSRFDETQFFGLREKANCSVT